MTVTLKVRDQKPGEVCGYNSHHHEACALAKGAIELLCKKAGFVGPDVVLLTVKVEVTTYGALGKAEVVIATGEDGRWGVTYEKSSDPAPDSKEPK